MASFEKEKALVQLLLDRLGLDGTLSDPNAGAQETGIDVLVHTADARAIGVQVTEADPYSEAGKARAQEKRAAGADASEVYAGWAQNDPQVVLNSLFRSISRKAPIAGRHSFASLSEVRLLVVASVPERGAAISTFVMTPWLSAAEMDQATHNVLEQSKYHRCFFLPVLGAERAFYRWERNGGWGKFVKLDDPPEIPRAAYVESLYRAAAAGDRQEVDRLFDEECREVLREMRDADN